MAAYFGERFAKWINQYDLKHVANGVERVHIRIFWRLQYHYVQFLADELDEAEEADRLLYQSDTLDLIVDCLLQKVLLHLKVPGYFFG